MEKNLVNIMNPSPNQKIIDVACGTGDIAKTLIRNSNQLNEIICVDPNEKMIQKVKKT